MLVLYSRIDFNLKLPCLNSVFKVFYLLLCLNQYFIYCKLKFIIVKFLLLYLNLILMFPIFLFILYFISMKLKIFKIHFQNI